MSDVNSHLRNHRIVFLIAAVSAFLTLYIIHLVNIQIIDGIVYQQRATLVSQRSTPIPAKRGEIYDRNGDLPLVLNVDSFALMLNPAEIPLSDYPQVFSRLSQLLNIPFSHLERLIPTELRKSYRFIEIKSSVDFETVSYIAERIGDFPGISWESKPIRSYVETGSLAHIIGYVGNINQEELQVLFNQGYGIRSVLGKAGLEKQYDLLLKGEEGTRFRTVDVGGRQVDTEFREEIPPVLGKDLVLTIDRKIQKLAEMALGPRTGSVVVLKPDTGEILAMVSYPYYNPNDFYTDNASQIFTQLSTDRRFPFFNRAIQAEYPPASTFKMILSAALLEENAFDPGKRILCTGKLEVGDRFFNCHKLTGHGPLNLSEALAESCNIYFYTVGMELGIERIAEYARHFGFGQISGVDLPNESGGLVPTSGWKQRRFNYPWLLGDTVNTSIGQGYTTVTPLQMANAVALIVNEGKIYKPHFIKEIRDSVTGEVTDTVEPEVIHEANISSRTFQLVKRALRGVITNGTANVVITTKAVKAAGKTGTAESGVKGSSNHSWFVAYAPYDEADTRDKIVLVVQVEASNPWEWWAPKAADIILQGIFADQTYEEAIATLRPWYL